MPTPFSLLVLDHLFWLNPAKANAAGGCPVSLRLTQHGQRTEVATGVRCTPAQWNATTHRLLEGRGAHPEAKSLNQALVSLEARVVLLRASLPADTKLADFRAHICPPRPKSSEAAAPRAAVAEPDALTMLAATMARYPNAGTRAAVVGALRKLRCFVAAVDIATPTPPLKRLKWEAFTPVFCAEFADWLAQGKSAQHCLALLRGLYKRTRPGLPNPFASIGPPRAAASPRPRHVLTQAQLKALAALPLPRPAQSLARDIYLTQYYLHGSRVGVVLELTWGQVDYAAGRVGFRAEKGGGWQSVSLRPPLRELLERYRAQRQAGEQALVFPLLPAGYFSLTDTARHRYRNTAESKIWRALQCIGPRIGLKRGALHSHTARHTLATHTVEATGDYRLAQRMLGHSTLAMTERYVKGMNHAEVDAGADAVYGVDNS